MTNKIINYIKTLSDNEKIQKLLVETIGKISFKQNNLEQFIKENNDKIIHIRDWIASVIENNEEWKIPRVLTINALNNSADKYFEKKNQKIQTIELDENHEKLVADLGDYYIIQMLTPQALDNESKVMQHCIGHGYYDENLKYEEYQYLSLRDKYNKAHATLEIENTEIIQLQGKQNELPDKKYINILIPWLIHNNYIFDLNKFGFVFNKNDNKIYSIDKIPDNCKIDGDLNLDGIEINSLPKNLTVNGLHLNHYTNIKELPNDIKINGDLVITDSNIETLPDNLIIGGSLHLRGCKHLKKLPNNLKIGKNLALSYCNIKELPNNLIFNGYLDLSWCQNLEILPDNLYINGDLDLTACTKIEKLPENLNVLHDCYLYDNINIKEISQKITIGREFCIDGTNIQYISKNLNCNTININDKQINLITKDINFKRIFIITNKTIYSKKEFFKKFKKHEEDTLFKKVLNLVL